MAAASDAEFELDGAKIRVRRAGAGPALLLLGDFLGPTGWAPYMDGLANNYSLVAPEHPGLGGAAIPAWLDNVSDLANFYLDFLETQKLDRVHLVGLGVGGWIAADLATRNDARLASLTLVNAAGITVRGVPQADIFLGAEDDVLRELVRDGAVAERIIAQTQTPESEDIRLQDQEVLARVTWQPRLNDPDLVKWLHRIRTPTHLVWSENNRLFPKAYGEAWRAALPGSRLSLIADCGHLAQFEKPDALVQTVTAFLSEARA